MKYFALLILIFFFSIDSIDAYCGNHVNTPICTGPGHCMEIAKNNYTKSNLINSVLELFCYDDVLHDRTKIGSVKWEVNGKSYNNAGDCLVLNWETEIKGDTAKVFCIIEKHPRTKNWQQVEGTVVGDATKFS